MRQPEFRHIREWLAEVGVNCRTIFCHFVGRWGGLKCEEHRMSTIIVATFTMSLLIGGGLTLGAQSLAQVVSSLSGLNSGDKIDSSGLVANSISSTYKTSVIAQPPKFNVSEEAKNCDLQNSAWQLWFGDKLNTDVEDTTYLSLPVGSAQALYRYLGDVPNDTCEYVFIPRGERVINYVISYDGIFQIVIGDNDYSTVTLRASDRIDGPLYYIKETKTAKTRPRLLSSAKQGALIRAELQRVVTEKGKFNITLTVTYQPEIVGDVDTASETFNWEFTPSSTTIVRPLGLSIGMIRAENDKSEISANFIHPNPAQTKSLE